MTEKEWKIIGEEFISYTGGNAIIISNGDFKFAIWEIKEDVQKICNKLNEWVDENKKLKKENKKLKYHLNKTEKELKEYKDFMSLGGCVNEFRFIHRYKNYKRKGVSI